MSGIPKVSVITATFQGEKRIVNLLEALKKQTYTDFEYIVVLDGPNDNTKRLVEEMEFATGKPMVIQNEKNVGRPCSLNKGAQQAKGDLIVFFDDDMIPEPDCLQRHVHFHNQQHADSLLVGNGYRNPKLATTDFQKFLIGIEKEWKETHQKSFDINLKNFAATTCNISLPKKLFISVGMFDERIRDAEDVNLNMKLLENGVPIRYDASVLAWHHDFPTLRVYVNRLSQYQKGNDALLQLFPEYRLKLPHVYKKKNKSTIKRILLKTARLLPLRSCDVYLQYFPWIPHRIKTLIFQFAISAFI